MQSRKNRMNVPKDWSFESSEVAKHFNTHVREQLPWYEMLTKTVGLIARHYIQQGGRIYDIGCELSDVIDHRKAHLVAIDNSEAMKAEYHGKGEFILADATEYDYKPFDLAILYLVVQFIPLERRKPLLEKLIEQCKTGGAVVMVDKYSSETDASYIQTIKRRITLMGKTLTGTPSEEIVAKELSLSGVQRPVDPADLFSGLGVKAHEFFRFGEFAGWIIAK